jgi:hypothetical protein
MTLPFAEKYKLYEARKNQVTLKFNLISKLVHFQHPDAISPTQVVNPLPMPTLYTKVSTTANQTGQPY